MGKTFSFHQRGKRALQESLPMKNTFVLLLLLLAGDAVAQMLTEPLSARPARLSALAPSFCNPLSVAANPAALAGLKHFSLAVGGEQRFLMRELGSYALHAIIPAQGNAFAVGLAHGGSADWNTTSASLAYGRKLGTAAAGVQFTYYNMGNTRYGHSTAYAADAGLLLPLSANVRAGLTFQQPVNTGSTKEAGVLLPARYSFAIAWEDPDQWLLSLEIGHEAGRRPGVLAGCTYVFEKTLRALIGFDTALSSAWIGAAIPVSGFQLQAIVMIHRELGPTPGLQLIYTAN
jgi:hypothetical protein